MAEAYRRAIFSAGAFAAVFGVISPKISTRMVRIPVPRPIAKEPKTLVTITVARDQAERLTTLFPMRIAVSILG